MMVLVIGGSGSGKSAWAEEYTVKLSGTGRRYYLATMRVTDRETEEKAAAHRHLRAGRGFVTIEQPDTIENALFKMEQGEKSALLECLSNLTANEMFGAGPGADKGGVADRIVNGIQRLEEELACLVVVTNNVFEDGLRYHGDTMEYMRVLGEIHIRLAERAWQVVEVTAGIPTVLKGKEAK